MKQLQRLGLVILIISFVACGKTSHKNEKINTPENWKTLQEPSYIIQYPDTFDIDKTGSMGTSFILLSQQKSEQDLFRENINLIVQNLAEQNIDLDKYVDISVKQIQTLITDGVLIESKRINDKSGEYQKVIYTGKQGIFELKWYQLYWIKNQKAYILTLSCEQDQFDEYSSIGEDIMKTFKLK